MTWPTGLGPKRQGEGIGPGFAQYKNWSAYRVRAAGVVVDPGVQFTHENQIRGLLKNLGLVIGRAKMNVFSVRAAELIEDRPELAAAISRPPRLSDRGDGCSRDTAGS